MLPADIIEFIIQQWSCKDPYCRLDFSENQWKQWTHLAYVDITKDGGKDAGTSSPFCIRLVGQSGSGKTSQLLPAIKYALEGQSYISLAVRFFAKYHPYLEKIKELYGEKQMREKTNAFALILLTLVLQRCIENKLPILLEMTLLTADYEHFVHELLRDNGYFCDYHCLAVSKTISDTWIQQRCQEVQREVSEKSSRFFFETLQSAFEMIQKEANRIPNRVFIWNHTQALPIISSFENKDLWKLFCDARKSTAPLLSLEQGLATKKTFMRDFYSKNMFSGK